MEDPVVDGRIILRWMLKNLDGDGWTEFDLHLDKDSWRAVLNVVMIVWVVENARIC